MSTHSSPSYTYTLLRTSIQRPTFQPHGAVFATSEPETLFSTRIYGLAVDQLDKCRKRIVGRESAGSYALCMWRDRFDGTDITLTPTQGNLTTVVQLRIQSVADGREEDECERVRFEGTEDNGDEVEQYTDTEVEVDNQSSELQVRVPHSEREAYDFAGTRIWLHGLPRKWSDHEQEESTYEGYSGNTRGTGGVPVLLKRFVGSSVDGDFMTTKWTKGL